VSLTAAILLDVFVIFVAAKVAGEIFDRLGQPSVIGELLAGVLIGPHVLGLIGQPGPAMVAAFHGDEAAREAVHLVHEVLAEIGVVFLLFFVGLETRLIDIVRVGRRASAVATAGIAVPFAFGFGFMTYLGQPLLVAIFIGTALVATSVGITARVLSDLGALKSHESRVILGAAVIDDILGMILLAVVISLASVGGVSWTAIGVVGLQAVIFVALVVLVGARVLRRFSAHLELLRLRNAPFVVAVAVCLGLAAVAAQIGLAGIIGAFLAGMVFAESREQHEIERQTMPLFDFLVPFFFVITGTAVDPSMFVDPAVIGVALALTALAVAGKLIGCGAAAWSLGPRSAAIIGVGMVPRGEVGLIVASIGRGLGALPDEVFSIVVVMSILTTVIVPPVLKLLYTGRSGERPRRVVAPAQAIHVEVK
jgi:Kef-type K+ transport system membrane component KefB